jgi:tetratricopeptide (TPR) repeat protein
VPELARWFEQALSRPERLSERDRARAIAELAWYLLFLNEFERSEQLVHEGLTRYRALGDELCEARLLRHLAMIRLRQGGDDESIRLHEQALAISRRLGDLDDVRASLHVLGEALRDVGDHEQATAYLQEAIEMSVQLGDRAAMTFALSGLGDLELDRQDSDRAAALYDESLEICLELGEGRGIAYALAGLASVAALRSDASSAGTLWGAVERYERQTATRLLAPERARYERALAALDGDEAFEGAREQGRALDLLDAVAHIRETRDSGSHRTPEIREGLAQAAHVQVPLIPRWRWASLSWRRRSSRIK